MLWVEGGSPLAVSCQGLDLALNLASIPGGGGGGWPPSLPHAGEEITFLPRCISFPHIRLEASSGRSVARPRRKEVEGPSLTAAETEPLSLGRRGQAAAGRLGWPIVYGGRGRGEAGGSAWESFFLQAGSGRGQGWECSTRREIGHDTEGRWRGSLGQPSLAQLQAGIRGPHQAADPGWGLERAGNRERREAAVYWSLVLKVSSVQCTACYVLQCTFKA